jgi:hypothetical protein
MSSFPELPPELRVALPDRFWNWWQTLRSYLLSNFFSQNDITILTKGKGIVLTNAAGTVTRRIRLNDAGTGIIIESL